MPTVFLQPFSFVGLDDEERTAGKNGKAAIAEQVRKFCDAVNAVGHSGRILYTWVNGDTVGVTHRREWTWNHHHVPGRQLRAQILGVRFNGARDANQGLRLFVGGTTTDLFTSYDLTSTTERDEPHHLEPFQASMEHAATASAVSCYVERRTGNGPIPYAGALFEAARFDADPSVTNEVIPTEHLEQGAPIVATAPGSSRDHLNALRTVFLHTWNRQRPQIAWSAQDAGANYVTFNNVTTSYRYVFNQTVGDGGTAPSATGPGITFPLYKSARGRSATVNVKVWVYAAMSGATDTGSIGIAHKDGAGGMTSIVGLSGLAISGTAFGWYELGPVALRADVEFERIVLCARSSGSTDNVRVGAFTLFPEPSTTIT